MQRLARRAFKHLLRSLNRQLIYMPYGVIGGLSIGEDIRILLATQNPVCVDVGANEGQTISLLRKYFARPQIYAFEPSSQMYSVLESNGYDEAVEVHNIALGDTQGRRELAKFSLPVMNSLLKIDPSPDNPFRDLEAVAGEWVEVTTLDKFLRERRIDRVDLLKVDTQGFDLRVLQGAAESLASGIVRNVYVELNFVPMYSGQPSAKEIGDYLEGQGFRLVDYYEKCRAGAILAWCNALYARQEAPNLPSPPI